MDSDTKSEEHAIELREAAGELEDAGGCECMEITELKMAQGF
jgi:hypothetical protein